MRRERNSWVRGLLGLLAALATGATLWAQVQTKEGPTRPEQRDGAWLSMHESFLKRAGDGDVGLLFLGDSITQGWFGIDGEGHGPRQVWDRYYGARNAANFGIGGDRTQHVLWRLDHGEVDRIHPKAVVLMIGTNNIFADSPAEIGEGVAAIVKILRAKLPETKILLLGVFPRGPRPDEARQRVVLLNQRISKLDDGKMVKYLDISKAFLEPNQSISQAVMPDHLHLSRKGYALWADAIEPTLHEMLEEK